MPSTAARLITQLNAALHVLGTQGGLMTPSVYATAQVPRFTPPGEARPTIDWLMRQQRADGGWGSDAMPLGRHIPTRAAVLALRNTSDSPESRKAVEGGLEF